MQLAERFLSGSNIGYRNIRPGFIEEAIPWTCRRLVVGTGAAGALPIMDEVIREAERRGVEVVALPTEDALDLMRDSPAETNAVLHVTC